MSEHLDEESSVCDFQQVETMKELIRTTLNEAPLEDTGLDPFRTIQEKLFRHWAWSYFQWKIASGIEKIILNMGLGEDASDGKKLKACVEDLTLIAGQKPIITKFKKSISNFKTRNDRNNNS